VVFRHSPPDHADYIWVFCSGERIGDDKLLGLAIVGLLIAYEHSLVRPPTEPCKYCVFHDQRVDQYPPVRDNHDRLAVDGMK